MKNARNHMDGISLHYYTVTGWSGRKGSAIDFDSEDYYWTLGKCLEVKDVVKRHCDIMDKYDPKKRIGLLVDEWGTWWDEEREQNPAIYISRTQCATPWSQLSVSTLSTASQTA